MDIKPSPVLVVLTFFRAVFSLMLGIALVFYPDKIRPVLVNFMGMFWLMSGLVGLRWGVKGGRRRWIAIATGLAAVITGGMVLLRSVYRGYFNELFVVISLGVVIVLTGLIHVIEGFPDVREGHRDRSRTSILLGIFEVVLGAVVIYTPLDFGPGVYWTAAIWAIIGGVLLFGQALFLIRHVRQTGEAPSTQ